VPVTPNLATQETEVRFVGKYSLLWALLKFSKPVGFDCFAIFFCILLAITTMIEHGMFESLLTTSVTFHDYDDEIWKFSRLNDWSRLHNKGRCAFYRSWRTSIRSFEAQIPRINNYFFDFFCIKQHRSEEDHGWGSDQHRLGKETIGKGGTGRTLEEKESFWFQRMDGLFGCLIPGSISYTLQPFLADFPFRDGLGQVHSGNGLYTTT